MDTRQNLFQIEWTQGNLNTIPWLVSILSTIACILISIVGFGIVIFSIMKNALAGLYAVSPKLWDRVDEIKKSNVSAKSKEGGNQLINVLGSIPTMLFKMLPNIKAMTEFEDEQMSPKVYFMKSLPLLCVEIFVGSFIFFGYPATFANKVQQFGTGVIDLVFANVDPTVFLEKLPGEITSYQFVTKGSSLGYDKNVLKIAKSGAATLASKYSDMTKEVRSKVALNYEQVLIEELASLGVYMTDEELWEVAVDTGVYTGSQRDALLKRAGIDPTSTSGATSSASVSEDGNTAIAVHIANVSSLGIGDSSPAFSAEADKNPIIAATLTFTRKASDDDGSGVSGSKTTKSIKNATLYVDRDKLKTNGSGQLIVEVSSNFIKFKNDSPVTASGGGASSIEASSGGWKINGSATQEGIDTLSITSGGLTYVAGSQTVVINKIVFKQLDSDENAIALGGSASTAYFVDSNGAWRWALGSAPSSAQSMIAPASEAETQQSTQSDGEQVGF